MIMDYTHMYPDRVIKYHTSKLQLYIDSDAAYLILLKVPSPSAGHVYLSDKLKHTTSIFTPKPNGPILIEWQTLRNVMLSLVEVEVGIVHHNGKTWTHIRKSLKEMKHP